MDLKSKIKRSGTIGQSLQLALRCKHKNFFTKEVAPEIIYKVQRGVIILLKQIADTGEPCS